MLKIFNKNKLIRNILKKNYVKNFRLELFLEKTPLSDILSI